MKGEGLKRFSAVAAVLAVPFALWALATNPPSGGGLYPPCIFNVSTGLHCPGCGGTRSLHLLLNGDFVGALQQNALLIAALPLMVWYLAALAVYALKGTWIGPKLNGARLTGIVAILVISFGIARNLPGLDFLAPKPLVANTP